MIHQRSAVATRIRSLPSPRTPQFEMASPLNIDYSGFSEKDIAGMEEVTRPAAKALLLHIGLLPVPPSNAVVLDNASGRGVVASVLFNDAARFLPTRPPERPPPPRPVPTADRPAPTPTPGGSKSPRQAHRRRSSAALKTSDLRVVCADREESMVRSAREIISSQGWNAEAVLADAQALPFPDNHFTHTLMNFAMQLIDDPALAAKESLRVLRRGGQAGFTSWFRPGWLEALKIAVPEFSLSLPPGTVVTMSTPDSAARVLADAGFTDIKVEPFKFQVEHDVHYSLSHWKQFFGATALSGDAGEKYDAYMKERSGDVGNFFLTWECLLVTGRKP
ncbi:S-adenosyl-L-methionine-dependent methyltransferase [Mycena metata]|uniref:S-adenosyl-L-methionine-dependent methyltransferase n=1 Tax=Mycena metata TaxID=1033252 RepID=A0AAD7MVE8_9AGAR|nr:S-adenosyl-L-methionine-dependent methyltransferase [Mycena metata]